MKYEISPLNFEDLDENEYKDNIISLLKGKVEKRAANRNNPYLKENLVEAISKEIEKYAPFEKGFEKKLYKTINKDELKRVYYGIVSVREYIPEISEILERLDDWEKCMLFAGIWSKRDIRDLYHKNLSETVESLIKEGYDFIHQRHMKKYYRKIYKRPLKIPNSQKFRKGRKGKFARIENRFQQLLDAESNGHYEDAERTSIFLDSCSKEEIEHLKKRFGKRALGGYAVFWDEIEDE